MSQNATFIFFSHSAALDQIDFISNSYYKPRTLDIYLNGIKISSFKVTKIGDEFILPLFVSQPGENTIKFYSKEGCDRISSIDNQSDPRCISFAFRNISIENVNKIINFINKNYDKNWYDLEIEENTSFRWMSQNATLTVFSFTKSSFKINVTLKSYYKPRILQVFLNENFICRYNISQENENIILNINLTPGKNVIKFHSIEGCDIPSKIENSTDSRCLSFAFNDIKIVNNY
jgi:hypothetical protein